MKINKTLFPAIVISLFSSCVDHDLAPLEPAFYWEKSTLPQLEPDKEYKFVTGDDGALYVKGNIAEQDGIFKATEEGWSLVKEFAPEMFNFTDFVVLDENIFFIRWTIDGPRVWKASDPEPEQMFPDKYIHGIHRLDSKFIVSGKFAEGNVQYGLASSADGVTLDYISASGGEMVPPLYFVHQANGKLYFHDHVFSTFEYDGTELRKSNLPQYMGINAIGSKGEIYTIVWGAFGNVEGTEIAKWYNGNTASAGYPLPDVQIQSLYIVNEKLVALSFNSNSSAFFLKKRTWLPISPDITITQAFIHNSKLFCLSADGTIKEFVDGI